MAITKMSVIKMSGDVRYIDETMIRCCKFGMFHPERAVLLQEYVKNNDVFLEYSENTGYLRKIVDLAEKLGLGIFKDKFIELKKFENDDKIDSVDSKSEEEKIEKKAYANPYKGLLQECIDISSRLNIKLRDADWQDLDMTIDEIKDYIKNIKSQIVNLSTQKSVQEENISHYKSVMAQFDNITNFNIDFDELFSCKYLKIRFGRLPKESYEKLKFFDDESFLFFSFKIDNNYSWCLYITPCYCYKKVDEMFKSLFFERVRIPIYAHGTPDSNRSYVKSQLDKYIEMLNYVDKQIKELTANIEKIFIKIYSQIKFFSECFDNKKYAAIFDDQFYIIGFIPQELERDFIYQFNNLEEVDITISDPLSDHRLKIPVKLKNNWFSRPFEEFVAMYGLPSYKGIDPTVFLSISYTILFGIMFGDIGQGLIIALIGYIWNKVTKNNFPKILTRIGLSSAFFGVIYGSCFGYEGLFESYIERIPDPYRDLVFKIANKDTNTLLFMSILLGVILIIFSMLFNIAVGLKYKKSAIYLFGQNGLAGLVFYASTIIAILGFTILKVNVISVWFICGCILLPILLIFLKEPLGDKFDGREVRLHGETGSFIMESFFEMYDILLNFMSNTISFIRVGAFVLSHAGMMMVVMDFARNMQTFGSIVVLVFGNIFVMVFEGLIVGIQVLRLQFYEMFSRCFDGSGKPFRNI